MKEAKNVFFRGIIRNRLGIFLLWFLLTIPVLYSFAVNPLVTNVYTADPSGFIGGDGRLYVICSHDQAGATDYSQLYDYILLSTLDFSSWQNHGVVFNARTGTTWANLPYL